jgi:hypothetical protein
MSNDAERRRAELVSTWETVIGSDGIAYKVTPGLERSSLPRVIPLGACSYSFPGRALHADEFKPGWFKRDVERAAARMIELGIRPREPDQT